MHHLFGFDEWAGRPVFLTLSIVNIPETNLYTCGLIDAGSEITILKKFLLKDWKEKIAKQKET